MTRRATHIVLAVLVLALCAGVGIASSASASGRTASAASTYDAYLPMGQAKRKAIRDARYITRPYTVRLTSCWRWTFSKVRCRRASTSDGITCTGVLQERRRYYSALGEGAVLYSTIREARCY